jgi:regulator of nucleoside diphosphate kinase
MEVSNMKKRRDRLRTREAGTVVVTEADAERLISFIQAQGNRAGAPRTVPELQRKLDDAEWLNSRLIPSDVVTMNSTVRLRDLESGEAVTLTLAFPYGADPGRGRISILTSLGTAMLGRRVGDSVECAGSDKATRFEIESVLYQPEAANDHDW